MRRKTWRVLLAGSLLAGVASVGWLWDTRPLLRPAVAADSAEILVGSNVQASAARGEVEHDGCTIVADPADVAHLFVASMHWPAAGMSGIAGYESRDGGNP